MCRRSKCECFSLSSAFVLSTLVLTVYTHHFSYKKKVDAKANAKTGFHSQQGEIASKFDVVDSSETRELENNEGAQLSAK